MPFISTAWCVLLAAIAVFLFWLDHELSSATTQRLTALAKAYLASCPPLQDTWAKERNTLCKLRETIATHGLDKWLIRKQ